MNNQQLIRTLCFTLGIACLLFVLNNLLITGVQHAEHAQTGKVSLLMNHRIDPQVMIFGASNGETGIDPEVLQKQCGKTVFNLCLDGTSVKQFGDLVREFNGYSQQAETIVFAIGPFAFENEPPSSLNRYYAWMNNDHLRNNPFLNDIPEFRKLKYVPFYGFVVYDSYFYKSAFDGWSRMVNHPVLPSSKDQLGWVPMTVQWGASNSLPALEDMVLNNDSSMVKEYEDLVKALNEKGRKVVFVLTPCHEEAMKHFAGYDQLRKNVQQLCTGTNQYIDLSSGSISMDKNNFYNYTHLNVKGAEVFSKLLGSRIRQ